MFRHFVLWPAATAVASSILPQQPVGPGSDQVTPPLWPLQQDANSTGLFPMPPCGNFSLLEASIDDMQVAMQNGGMSSVQLVACYMKRVFQTQPYINAVLQHNPDVFAIASQMDLERHEGTVRSKLHGIPFLVKDNIGTADNMETTAGSWALVGSRPPRDSFVVKRLRDAGAVLFGKATLSEWADMRSNNYSEGYSGRGGQARSPYNFTVNPGGSSTGSANAVAANAIAFALGTETDGSVINPACRSAVVGIKPTVGLTSRAGVIPESEHQDTVGTFGKTCADAVYALDAIYGIDPDDNYTSAQAGHTPPGGYAQFLTTKTALKDVAFGIPWNSFWVYADAEEQQILISIVDMMREAGATIINHTEITNYQTLVSPDGWDWDWGTARGYPNESEYTYIKVDFYNNIQTYLAGLRNTNIGTLADIVQYNYDNDGAEGGNPWPLGIPAFYSGQDGFLASLTTNGTYTDEYWQALTFCQTSTRDGIDDALRQGDFVLNGLLVPSDVAQAPQIAAQAGYPMVSVPAGVHAESKMPFGLGIMQTAWGEAELVRAASAIEDLLRTAHGAAVYGRTLPTWQGYLERPIPVCMSCPN